MIPARKSLADYAWVHHVPPVNPRTYPVTLHARPFVVRAERFIVPTADHMILTDGFFAEGTVEPVVKAQALLRIINAGSEMRMTEEATAARRVSRVGYARPLAVGGRGTVSFAGRFSTFRTYRTVYVMVVLRAKSFLPEVAGKQKLFGKVASTQFAPVRTPEANRLSFKACFNALWTKPAPLIVAAVPTTGAVSGASGGRTMEAPLSVRLTVGVATRSAGGERGAGWIPTGYMSSRAAQAEAMCVSTSLAWLRDHTV